MTFAMVGSVRAPGILNGRPAGVPSAISLNPAESDFLRLLARTRANLGVQLGFHHVPGRLRLRTGTLKQHAAKLDALCTEFEAVPGVRSATANQLTGSIVVDYDPLQWAPNAVATAIADDLSLTDEGGLPSWTNHIGTKLIEWGLEKLAIALIVVVV